MAEIKGQHSQLQPVVSSSSAGGVGIGSQIQQAQGSTGTGIPIHVTMSSQLTSTQGLSSSTAPMIQTQKPVPMKLFSSWEVDRTPPNCIPRLCVLTLTHLTISRPLVPSPESTSSAAAHFTVFIAVKMVGSRRTLRSNEISLGPGGLAEVDLELHFSLQYPHFLKREENKLLIMLQRRKKYKNRTILGYRTLAEGAIDMALVLQRTSNLILQLNPTEISSGANNNKENVTSTNPNVHAPVASVHIVGLSSQPVDELDDRKGKASRRFPPILTLNASTPTSILSNLPGGVVKGAHKTTGIGGPQAGDFCSDDEDEFSSQSSDSPPDDVGGVGANGNGHGIGSASRKGSHGIKSVGGSGVGNRNLKQKIVSLLRKFKQSEVDLVAEGLDVSGAGSSAKKLGQHGHHHHHHRPPHHHHSESLAIEELFDELECFSDSHSEPDADTLSVGSLPRPVLPPFFSSSRNLAKELHYTPGQQLPADSDSYTEPDPEPESPKFPRSRHAAGSQISSSFVETPVPPKPQQTLSSAPDEQSCGSTTGFPSLVIFISNSSDPSSRLITLLKSSIQTPTNFFLVDNETDVKTHLASIVNRVQKFCNTNSRTPPPVTVVGIGPEVLLSWIAKSYVNQLSSKPHDWQGYFSFIFVNGGQGQVHKLLCSQDPYYSQLFEREVDCTEPEEFVHRLISYIHTCTSSSTSNQKSFLVHLPIAEAMITYKEESEESSQVFLPFISDVRLNVGYGGSPQGHQLSVDQSTDGNEPPGIGLVPAPTQMSSSPPSPQVVVGTPGLGVGIEDSSSSPSASPLELQVDYWKGTVKSSIKAHFRSLTIQRTVDNFLSLSYVLKEQKKQKIMRLGKKKDRESETTKSNQGLPHFLEGISRLVCLSKSQTPIKLHVDGTEWLGVKFFQISAQWPSGVKALPLLISRGLGSGD